jgi:hypothetical protein
LPAEVAQNAGDGTYRIASLAGQLRWEREDGPVTGNLATLKGVEHARPDTSGLGQEFKVCCDLQPTALSRLESSRGGRNPVFWVDLSGSWAIHGRVEGIYHTPWRFVVPNDMWLAFLTASGYHDYEFIEIRLALSDAGDLRRAVSYLNAARRLLAANDHGRAVGLCRLIIEAADESLREHAKAGTLGAYLTERTDERRGDQYSRIVAAVKQLAALDHHDYGADSRFAKAEALAVIRMCEALLMLAGELAES